jgi:hypothetical protein
MRRAALFLALLVLAATVTGVAQSAAMTAVPKQLTGKWTRNGWGMTIYSSGLGGIGRGLSGGDVEFSRVTAHRLTFGGGPVSASCSGNGRYRWKVAGHRLKLKKINDACKPRVHVLAGIWWRPS